MQAPEDCPGMYFVFAGNRFAPRNSRVKALLWQLIALSQGGPHLVSPAR